MTTGDEQVRGETEGVAGQPHIISSVDQLYDGVAYLLPHELESVKQLLLVTESELRELGDLKNEAMHQSSETWHDNAPADAIKHSSQVPTKRFDRLNKILGSQFLLEYPSTDTLFATIGSRVSISVNNSDPFTIDIVGIQGEAPSDNPDMEVCTYRAPLAQAIIGKYVGDKTIAAIGTRDVEVEILSIDQEAQKTEYESSI